VQFRSCREEGAKRSSDPGRRVSFTEQIGGADASAASSCWPYPTKPAGTGVIVHP
jgi:hypothetical protein